MEAVMAKSTFWSEFKTFIARGNVMDMAVGVVVGGAFTAIVNSLVGDIINPIIGKLFGGVDLSEAKVVLTEATEEAAEVAIRYGALIQAIINFLIMAFVIFLIMKALNKLMSLGKKEEEKPAEPPKPSDEVVLLTEIRDLLKKGE
jgi:large conductance mechanosensitive channel